MLHGDAPAWIEETTWSSRASHGKGRRFHCTLCPEGGVPTTCEIIGTVVEVKPDT